MINITPLQNKIIRSNKEWVVIKSGKMEGATTGLLLKGLSGVHHTICSGYRDTEYSLESFLKILEDGNIDYTISRSCMFSYAKVVFFEGLSSLTFVRKQRVTEYLQMHPRLDSFMVDNIEQFSQSLVDSIFHYCQPHRIKQSMFTTSHEHCGWRNPRYRRGDIVVDDKGNIVWEEYSWDNKLIDWKTDFWEGDNSSSTGNLKTKATLSDYKPFVEIIQ